MKHRVKYIVLASLFLLVACGKQTNWRFSLDKNSTEPYGLYLAFTHLKEVFPNVDIITIYDLMEDISAKKNQSKRKTLLLSITNNIYLNSDEASALHEYVAGGGDVLMISNSFSEAIDSVFGIENISQPLSYPPTKKDSLSIHLMLWDNKWYEYEMDLPFAPDHLITNDNKSSSLGSRSIDGKIKSNFVVKEIGSGQIVFGNSPEMLTNYALLKDSNIQYFEQLFSHFNRYKYKIKWFSKHTLRPKRERPKSNFLELLKQKPYRYAFMVLLLMAILFLVFETKRRQRIIKVVPPVTNDSLAFIETIGKLYYGEKDNRNLAGKMILYYLEHIRSAYNISTAHLNKEMALKLARKINKPEEQTEQFINYLNLMLTASDISETEIKKLYQTLKKYS